MRYGVVATKTSERVALVSGRAPIPIFDALVPLVQTRALMAAVRFGVFEALRDGARRADEVASACELDAECTRLLLRVLVFATYVRQRGDTFTLTKLARRTMLRGATLACASYVQFNYTQWSFFDDFERVLQSGRGIDMHGSLNDTAQRDYLNAMADMSRLLAPVVARAMPVKAGAKTLLDIGGSHGLYAAAVARRHQLEATVLDLPATQAHREAVADTLGTTEVTHRSGDALTTHLGTPDAILIGNLVHHLSESDSRLLVRRAYDALTPRGTLAIWEAEQPSMSAKADHADAMTLYFKLTSSGRCYEAKNMADWLRDAGFVTVAVKRPLKAPGFVLISGAKP